MQTHAVLHLAFAEIAQTRRPLPVLDQIIRHVLRHEDVPGVAAIHYPLRHVDPGAGDVSPPAHILHLTHRSAVNAHTHWEFRMALLCFSNLERTSCRFRRTPTKD